jgi:hypothetical protein
MENLLTEKTVFRTGNFKKIIIASIKKSVPSLAYYLSEHVFYLVLINIAYKYEF